MDLKRWTYAVAPVAAAVGLGTLGSLKAASTYGRLEKPAWAPPAGVFGPVWSALYATVAVAGWRMYPAASGRTRALHLTQLALNAAWPATFFTLRDKRVSIAVITALDAALTAEIARLAREDAGSAALLLPYLAWSGFATGLNLAVSEPGPGQ